MLPRINNLKFYAVIQGLQTLLTRTRSGLIIVLILFIFMGRSPYALALPLKIAQDIPVSDRSGIRGAIEQMTLDKGASEVLPDVSIQGVLKDIDIEHGATEVLPTISVRGHLEQAAPDSISPTFTQLKISKQVPAEKEIEPSFPEDIGRILKRGELIVAMLGIDNPPFFERAKGNVLSGLDVDIGRSIARELGVKVRFDRSPKTFNEAVELVQRRKADLAISKLSISLRRAKQMKFSLPYVTMRQALLVNRLQLAQRMSGGFTAEEVIRGLDGKVGVIQGTQYSLFAKKRFPKSTVVEFPKWTDAVDAVGKGEILAAFRDELEIKKVLLLQPDFALQVQTVAFSDTTDLLAVVGHWQSSQLIDFVNYDLSLNKLSYTADQLIKTYENSFRKE
ncbi:substrate-binding periplasmic protein [Pseudanabaena sp. PCC 6802]|uniref:substrate-binding periplasmic protein n=1 Tax=Pseudanabaena sp. PCC 6802 TaxID=118173 RepID=UPI00034BEAB5|nr:transporter substrate-binding domain-containing protein [Pseudanabaena sp. PCC 6802]